MKRVIIVHGWTGSPNRDWLPWLAAELARDGAQVIAPRMPHPLFPTIESWVRTLEQRVGTLTPDTYFVGHSVGCQAIIRYLDRRAGTHPDERSGGAVFVAGWLAIKTQAEAPKANTPRRRMLAFWLSVIRRFARRWETQPIDFERASNALPRSTLLLSDTDFFVPLDRTKRDFERLLGSRTVVFHHAGHFTRFDGYRTFPELLAEVRSLLNG